MTGYLGSDRTCWRDYDASALAAATRYRGLILIDQGSDDKFLAEQLKPDLFVSACRASGTRVQFRLHDRYDHSYYFVSTFMEDHLRHHASVLLPG